VGQTQLPVGAPLILHPGVALPMEKNSLPAPENPETSSHYFQNLDQFWQLPQIVIVVLPEFVSPSKITCVAEFKRQET
jgi:hypothetical protein